MPNRILKESICTSASVDKLGWFEEVVFYRLIVNADDYGRLDARPAVLRARLFPLKDITLEEISAAIHRLQAAGCIALYEAQGAPYLYLPSWDKHQHIRTKREKYPAPSADCVSASANCVSASADCCPNPIQSESESLSESESNPPSGESEERFDAFWQTYPRRVKRYDAWRIWQQLSPDGALTDRIIRAVEAAKKTDSWRQEGGKYVPYPHRYLQERRWEDEPAPVRGIESNLDTAMMDKLVMQYTPTFGEG